MIAMIWRRLLVGVFVMWAAVTFMFVLVRLAPGDPASLLLGPDANPAQVAALSHQLGLDGSVVTQYGTYLVKVVHLDFGSSFLYGQPAMTTVLSRLTAAIQLTLAATCIAVVIGLSLGLIASRRPDSRVDRAVSSVSILLQGMPTFWVGTMFILIFALMLRLLPSSGYGKLSNLVLPAVTRLFAFNRADRCSWLFPAGIGGCKPSVSVVSGKTNLKGFVPNSSGFPDLSTVSY